jgi:hypothetical protein
MRGTHGVGCEGETDLKSFAARLTDAAYPITLRAGTADSWAQLQVDLGRALAETIKKWGCESPRFSSPSETEAWREGFLADLTDEAYRTALYRGMTGSFLDVELGLYRAFRSVLIAMGRKQGAAMART